MPNIKKATVKIKGMHCPSCEILVQDRFGEVKNVQSVQADFKTGKAEIQYIGKLNKEGLNSKIREFGYKISERGEEEQEDPYVKRLSDAAVISAIVFILYFFAQELNIIPHFNSTSGLTLTTVFILGLVASTSTCMATSGVLFLATVGKLKKEGVSFTENIIPAISFNTGRVLMYAFFGLLTGYVGKSISGNLQLGSVLSVAVSLMMVLIGLNMLKLIPSLPFLQSNFTKGLFLRLEQRLISSPKRTSFLLGAITYLLPCGFTQTVQLYALGLADPIKSATVMTVFALGTVPVLMAIGFVSAGTKSSFYAMFYRVAGVLILLIGVSYFVNYLSVLGVSIPFVSAGQAGSISAQVKEGYQVINMKVDSNGYTPNSFTLKKDTPVKWIINGDNVFGCQGYIRVPKLGIRKVLEKGQNIIEFIPKNEGQIQFSCGMGMYKGIFKVM